MAKEPYISNIAGRVPTVSQLEQALLNVGYNRVDALFYGLKIVGGVKSVVCLGAELSPPATHARLHSMISAADHAAAAEADYNKVVATNATTGAIEYIEKNIEDISFEFRDITLGTEQKYILDIKASYPYKIISAIMQTDDGTLFPWIVCNETAVLGLDGFVINTDITEVGARTGENETVNTGDLVYLWLAATGIYITGSPTLIRGKLKLIRI